MVDTSPFFMCIFIPKIGNQILIVLGTEFVAFEILKIFEVHKITTSICKLLF